MGSQGTTTVNFGAFPGAHEATATVTGQTTILSGSLVEAWLFPTATTDHSVDEHYAEFPSIKVWAQAVVASTGFTIVARYDPDVREGLSFPGASRQLNANATQLANSSGQPTIVPSVGGTAPRIYGEWTVAWVWN